ncbi:hypothetical protein [Flavobacterium sp. 5]|uniref:hypothetical protein n=1 Tax=Flavobacterium sp. 5 TaxID=2035199 RepID=UPI0012FE47DE|nr:hypothetical protein [Flavobacterium sp. 5]
MFALPLAAFALASAGTASTNESGKSKMASPITAYIHSPLESSCAKVTVECNPTSGQTCLSSSNFEAFGKDNEGNRNVQLHRN